MGGVGGGFVCGCYHSLVKSWLLSSLLLLVVYSGMDGGRNLGVVVGDVDDEVVSPVGQWSVGQLVLQHS